MDFDREEEQTLSLFDLSFNPYVSVPIKGSRVGVEVDLSWKRGPLSLTAEAIGLRFDGVNEDHVGLYGGFVQPAYFLTGDTNKVYKRCFV